MKNIYLVLLAIIFSFSAFSQISSTAAGGNWSSPTTWVGGVVPTGGDDVIIVDGSFVTIDIDADAQSITVGEGTSGVLQFEAVNPRTLTVGNDVTIVTGGILRSSTSGSVTTHILSVGGNLINNGTLNFSTNGDTAGAGIIFTGSANAEFSGSGGTTDISLITIDKGTDTSSILELHPDNFTFKGAASTSGDLESFLDIINGTFKISGTFTMDNGLFIGTGPYLVPASGGLWLNNPNFTVNGRAGTLDIEGLLQVDAGTLNVGSAINNRLGYIAGTVININGGTVNVASRFSASSTFGIIYTQTGGILNLNTIGNSSGLRASFDIQNNDNSTFTMSGGTIVLQNAGTSGSGPRDYFNDATNINITGGTLQVGNSSSGSAQTFFLFGSTPSLLIDNTAGGHTAQLFGNLVVNGNTTITSGATLALDDGTTGYTYTQLGDSFTNSGTLNGTMANATLSFSGTAPQTYGGDGLFIAPVSNLEMNNAAGLTITNTIPSSVTTSQLSMLAGDIVTGVDTLTVGTSLANLGIVNYVAGTVVGKFKKWIDATTGNTDFQVGIPGSTRTASIDFTTAPSTGGTLTAEWLSLYPGANGLPLTEPGYPPIDSVASDGYWKVSAGDGLTGGIYTGTFTGTNVTTVIDYTKTVLVKRADNVSPWTLDGTHVPTTGSNTTPVLSRTGMSGFSEFGIGGKAAVAILPLTVEYFKGSKQITGNFLDWKISCNASPSATMSLERSTDARKFSPLTIITATATRCLQPFNYTDVLPAAGVNYYRIKVTDADGRAAYSNIIALLNKEKGFDIVAMMPNPVHDITTLSIASAVAAKMDVVITDISGKKVQQRTIDILAGSNQVNFDFNNLPAGTYQITGYTKENGIKTLQFIKN